MKSPSRINQPPLQTLEQRQGPSQSGINHVSGKSGPPKVDVIYNIKLSCDLNRLPVPTIISQ